jgi:DNA-directed RNA polymerase specialized sigma24 family protein
MGKTPDQFLTTRWSVVLAATGEDSVARQAKENLFREAWRPLYAFARRWGCSQPDAEDAVQGFITSLLERDSLRNVAPGSGRFRSFLLGGMKNHLNDMADRAGAQKRGGNVEHTPLDGDAVEQGYLAVAAQLPTPERAFDRVWALGVLEKAKAKLAEECAASGKGVVFAALFPEKDGQAPEDYATLSGRLGMSEGALRSLAMRLRRRWRELIRAELAELVDSRVALDEEMNALQAALID